MKRQITFIAMLMCVAFTFSVLPGCSTTPAGKATQTEGVVIPAVNAAMGAWATYVKDGKATQAQIDAVKNAYNGYYTAQLASEAVILYLVNSDSTNAPSASDIQAASDAVSAAETSLINLINSYIK